MELEELGDKNDVEVDVLDKSTNHPSLRGQERFPRDEAVLARFGKQQQFRVSLPIHASKSQLHAPSQSPFPERTFSLIGDTLCSEDSASYL